MRLLTFWPTSVFKLAYQLALASVLAIDYGTDFITACLMKFKPGVPFNALLNKYSKRKVNSTVVWKRVGGFLDRTLLITFVVFLSFGLRYLILILVYRAQDSLYLSENLTIFSF